MKQARAALAALALCIVSALAGPAWAGCTPGEVAFRTKAGVVRYRVELATTEAERQRGLMHRRSLARDAGMLFLWPQPRSVAFWMRNTLIPLDMIFIDARGRVTRVHARARPLDETPIPGGQNVLAVLEINGGEAARAGIRPGVTMRAAAMPQDRAVWRCDAP